IRKRSSPPFLASEPNRRGMARSGVKFPPPLARLPAAAFTRAARTRSIDAPANTRRSTKYRTGRAGASSTNQIRPMREGPSLDAPEKSVVALEIAGMQPDLNPYAPPAASIDFGVSPEAGAQPLADRGTRFGARVLDTILMCVAMLLFFLIAIAPDQPLLLV